ncbi:MAG: pyridoxamine 5'-phosphate oxidase family protein [Syntrophorhabdales bacterium]|jgi:nitroimidazol reductase NimA-like FMN-containing flavoprotein (pyridoxamine 5'-phosphate oxidase superfamily)
MRVAKKEIRDRGVLEGLLRNCPVGRLGTVGSDGYPVIKPLNFVFLDGHIYFHSAREGEKIDDMARDGRVCFEVDSPIGFVKAADHPCSADYLYQSIIIKGRAHVAEKQDERMRALKGLMEKYQPEGGYDAFAEDKLALTAVVRIDIIEMTGKEDLGQSRAAPSTG